MKPSYRRLASDTLVFATGNVLVKLIQFFLLPMYTALLTTGEYGVAELVNNLAELLWPLACLGIYEGVLRFAIDDDLDRASVLTTGLATSAGIAPVVIAVGIAGYAVTGFDCTGYLVVLCLVAPVRSICLQFTKGIGMTRLYTASGIVGALSLCAFGYTFLGVLHMGTSGYLTAIIVSQFVQLAVVTAGARLWQYIHPDRVDSNLLKKLLSYSLPMIPNALCWWFVHLSGRYIVLFFDGTAAAGTFAAASKLPAIINMVVTIFQQAWQLFSAREYGTEGRNDSFGDVFEAFSAFLLCAGALTIALTRPLCSFMLSGDFFDAYHYVPVLMLGAVINGYSMFFGTIYNAAKRNTMIFVTTMAGAFTNIAIGAALAPLIGAWGPAIGSVAAYSVISLVRIVNTRRLANVRIDIPYQIAGLLVLVAEVIRIAGDAPGATTLSLVLSGALVVTTVVHYRATVAKLIGSLRKKG